MNATELLADAARRPLDLCAPLLDGLSAEDAHTLPAGAGNSIAWLLWHAARQMDVQTAALAGSETVWSTGGWAERLGVDRPADDFGFGDARGDVEKLKVKDIPALGAHLEACIEALVAYLRSLSDADLDAVVDESYTPAVTRGARLVSIIDDAVVHVGQAAYARGIVDGWSLGV